MVKEKTAKSQIEMLMTALGSRDHLIGADNNEGGDKENRDITSLE